MNTARAIAHSNIALVKYWGKRVPAAGQRTDLNVPAVGSLSLTLDALRTETIVGPAPSGHDSFSLNGVEAREDQAAKVLAHLDRLWALAGCTGTRPPCHVHSVNFLPTASGLASSASGFAALTLAAAAAWQLESDRERLSAWARMGSGSAARSLWGGFVRLDAGTRPDGSDCRAHPVFARDHWPQLRLLVVQTTRAEKPVGSTEGMERSRTTSPYYEAWIEHHPADLDRAQEAIGARELQALGEVTEHSCFKMHASMMASRPPILYWNGTTVEVVRAVWEARQHGEATGYVTMDAGPHVKVLCHRDAVTPLVDRLQAIPGVEALEPIAPGPDATVEVMS